MASVEDTVASVAVIYRNMVVQPLGRLAVDGILVFSVKQFPLTEAVKLILVIDDGAPNEVGTASCAQRHFGGGKNTRP